MYLATGRAAGDERLPRLWTLDPQKLPLRAQRQIDLLREELADPCGFCVARVGRSKLTDLKGKLLWSAFPWGFSNTNVAAIASNARTAKANPSFLERQAREDYFAALKRSWRLIRTCMTRTGLLMFLTRRTPASR